jgi:hypothetical protein
MALRDDKEYELIKAIGASNSASERSRLIRKLDQLPVRIRPFYSRWMIVHDIYPFDCWTDEGYDSTRSDVPRDIQLLWAASYGKSDIANGGFHQFFTNPTGVFAPEMIEWFTRAALPQTAAVMQKSIARFGRVFPRSQEARQEFLAGFEGDSREECDPFYDLDDQFYASLPSDVFSSSADLWLRETCGINRLDQSLTD